MSFYRRAKRRLLRPKADRIGGMTVAATRLAQLMSGDYVLFCVTPIAQHPARNQPLPLSLRPVDGFPRRMLGDDA